MGTCPLTWRQGLKHDAAAVDGAGRGRPAGDAAQPAGEEVDVEPQFVYPLLKGADLRKAAADRPRRARHRHPAADRPATPRRLEQTALQALGLPAGPCRSGSRGRKSSIYRGQPPFAMFGVGPYSFAPFKVAVSGLHRRRSSRLSGPVDGRPVMLDDTCYFLPCRRPEHGRAGRALCHDPTTLELIRALSFPDAKRPMTKGAVATASTCRPSWIGPIERELCRARPRTVLRRAPGHRPSRTVDGHRATEVERLAR